MLERDKFPDVELRVLKSFQCEDGFDPLESRVRKSGVECRIRGHRGVLASQLEFFDGFFRRSCPHSTINESYEHLFIYHLEIPFEPAVLVSLIDLIYCPLERQIEPLDTDFLAACDFFGRRGPWIDRLFRRLPVFNVQKKRTEFLLLELISVLFPLIEIPSFSARVTSLIEIHGGSLSIEQKEQLNLPPTLKFFSKPDPESREVKIRCHLQGGDSLILLDGCFSGVTLDNSPNHSDTVMAPPPFQDLAFTVHLFAVNWGKKQGLALSCPPMNQNFRARISLRFLSLSELCEKCPEFKGSGQRMVRQFHLFQSEGYIKPEWVTIPQKPRPLSEWEKESEFNFHLPFGSVASRLIFMIPPEWKSHLSHFPLFFRFQVEIIK